MAEAKNLTVQEQIATKRQELIEAKRGHAAGELQNPRAIGKIRKEIARLLTEQNNKTSKKGDE